MAVFLYDSTPESEKVADLDNYVVPMFWVAERKYDNP